MLLLYHPYIVSLKEMVVLDPYYYLFMEYVGGGQLLDYIISHGKLKEKHARRFARQILSALDYCHRNSIVHRDLKIENILISQSGHVKIIDFGLSNLFSPRSHLSTFCGSLYFAAPELLSAKSYTGPEVDVWSFGVVLFVLVCGKVPFDDQSMPALHAKIKRGQVDYPSHLSSDCKNLLSRMLVTNPSNRATVSEIIMHPWMNRGYDTLVDSHLPHRAPLTLPVDMEVVQNMTGFGFGTEAEIKKQLEGIITSTDYQKAVRSMGKRPTTNGSSPFSRHHSPLHRKSTSAPSDDPQSIPAAYHPLVSIYYLVKERMERERRAATDSDTLGGSFDVPSGNTLKIPDISKPETAHSADGPLDHTPFDHRGTVGVAFGRRGKTNIKVDDDGHIIEADRPGILEGGLHRLMNRSHFSRSSESEHDPEANVFRRLSQVLHRPSLEQRRHSRTQSTDAAMAPAPGPSKSEKLRKKKTSTTEGTNETGLGHKVNKLLSRAGSTNLNEHHHQQQQQQRRPRQATVSGTNPVAEGRVVATGKAPAQALPELAQEQKHDPQMFPAASSVPSQGTADETVKPVFLKGLFSVTTTSTKHPSVIRADLIRVLERTGVKWREGKGRFECVHMPSIDMKQVVTEDANHSSPVTVPDLIVRFEIYIVKVPWLLGMHGLQFRRVSGDPFLYKNMCSRILAELKL